MNDFIVYTHAERPDLKPQGIEVAKKAWSPFMRHHKIIKPRWEELFIAIPDFQFTICTADEQVVAVGNTIPLHWDGSLEDLPAGWDDNFERGWQTHDEQLAPTVLSAVSAAVDPSIRQQGLGELILRTMLAIGQKHGLGLGLLATVRPNFKSHYPLIPIEDYADWRLADGSIFDPWLRLHDRLGAKRLVIAHESKNITGTVAQWETWTKHKLPQDGHYPLRDMLVPLVVENGTGTYLEPNVWMHYA